MRALEIVLPLLKGAMTLPPLSVRGDLGGALGAMKLLRAFSEIVDSLDQKDSFVRKCVELLAFLLAGCSLEYPLHGSGAIAEALIRGIQKQRI
ncbi:hypothetical protein SAY86_003390 [Trapa natans]|uniref:Uncharacterized protein n=1 Tax=Trapa natans TaxID=22666 RepID=A0AAN7N3W0_TRANT|nr:hypothetical protein SAY86_003390 [Trapa natans]